jgi:hypothetical protein
MENILLYSTLPIFSGRKQVNTFSFGKNEQHIFSSENSMCQSCTPNTSPPNALLAHEHLNIDFAPKKSRVHCFFLSQKKNHRKIPAYKIAASLASHILHSRIQMVGSSSIRVDSAFGVADVGVGLELAEGDRISVKMRCATPSHRLPS